MKGGKKRGEGGRDMIKVQRQCLKVRQEKGDEEEGSKEQKMWMWIFHERMLRVKESEVRLSEVC